MDLYEHQGRTLFARHGLPVLDGRVAATAEEVGGIAERLAVPVVVKAQVKVGGRGKAGGIAVASGAAEAQARASEILGMTIKGHRVNQVMVTPAADIAAEYYLSYLLDRSYPLDPGSRGFLCVATARGGVDIETVAREQPDQVLRMAIEPTRGVDRETAAEIVTRAGFPAELAEAASELAIRLWRLFVAEDATLVEVNPLARTADGRLLCLDAKVTLDDNARFRHPDHAEFVDVSATDPIELLARKKNLNYVKLDGQVGIIGNGAGLVMSTLDVVADAGRSIGVRPANFLDLGGGASAAVMADGLQTVLGDPAVRVVFVNVFGGITACDAVAEGIVQAVEVLAARGEPMDRPLVVRLDGNNAGPGRAILARAGHPLIQQVDTMDEAARRAAILADQPAYTSGASSVDQAGPARGAGSAGSGEV